MEEQELLQKKTEAQSQETPDNQEVTLDVDGMTCTNCALGVKKYLEKEGYQGVEVSFANGQAVLRDSDPESIRKAIQKINSLGYQASPHQETEEASEKSGLAPVEVKFLFSLPFTLLLMLQMGFHWEWLARPYVQLALTLPVYGLGLAYFGQSAYKSLRSGVANMDLLITLGATAAFFYSLYGTLAGAGADFLFYETAAGIITLVLLGNVLEHRAVRKTTTSMQALMNLQQPKALKVHQHNGTEELQEVPTNELLPGDLLQVNNGQAVPVDGKVVEGRASLNESMLTGESLPVEKEKGDEVVGGTYLVDGNLRVQATAVGNKTMLSQIIRMVQKAQDKRPGIQKLSDRVSEYFVPIVIGIALLTFSLEYFVFAFGLKAALLNAVAVLVISCPCAMGLAVPTAVVVGIGKAARRGILIKGADTLERLNRIKTVVFDKTGTLTTGELQVSELLCRSEEEKARARSLFLALESASSHPIAQSVYKAFAESPKADLEEVKEEKGRGMRGRDADGKVYRAVSMKEARLYTTLEEGQEGEVILLENDQWLASLRLEDELKPHAVELIQYLKSRNIRTVLLSGDRAAKCRQIATYLGLDTVYSEKLPEEKLDVLRELAEQEEVAMVGDGINDAPALALASVGISLSNASQAAMESAQIILLNESLQHLEKAFQTGQQTLSTIRQNLFWAFFYNILAIPPAALGYLSPLIAAAAMAFSDVIVVGNSLRLRFRKR